MDCEVSFNLFFFNLFMDLNVYLKIESDVVGLVSLTAAPNWVLTESCIDKNLKLEDWNNKTES